MNYVISIINPEALDTLCAICAELKLPMTVVMHGRGTAVQSMMDLLGIESNEKRVVLTVADSDKTKQLDCRPAAQTASGRSGSRHRHCRAGKKYWRWKGLGIS